MELAAAQLYGLTRKKRYEQDFYQYLVKDSVAKWMGKDTAAHYQYYPYNNLGIYAMEAARGFNAYNLELELTSRSVIDRVSEKVKKMLLTEGCLLSGVVIN